MKKEFIFILTIFFCLSYVYSNSTTTTTQTACTSNCDAADGCASPDGYYYGGYYRDYYCSTANKCSYNIIRCTQECVDKCDYYRNRNPEKNYNCCNPDTTQDNFHVSEFSCNYINIGWQCKISYTGLSHESHLVLLFSNNNGKIINAPGGIIKPESNEFLSNFYCNSQNSGQYNVSWIRYERNDTNMLNPTNWSLSNSTQNLVC